jgi:hypothetical protein
MTVMAVVTWSSSNALQTCSRLIALFTCSTAISVEPGFGEPLNVNFME